MNRRVVMSTLTTDYDQVELRCYCTSSEYLLFEAPVLAFVPTSSGSVLMVSMVCSGSAQADSIKFSASLKSQFESLGEIYFHLGCFPSIFSSDGSIGTGPL